MSKNNVADIKNRLSIDQVIGDYITLKKAGPRFKANCPFHKEKTPSFTVSPELQIWKCFGCGEGGDIFSFVEKIEGVEFYDALKILGKKAGIDITPQSQQHKTNRDALLATYSYAKTYFHQQLTDPIKQYLVQRGIKDQLLQEFQIGFAPFNGQGLITFLQSKKISVDFIKKAGLHHRFNGRIIFPITNPQGVVVAFGGRKLTDELYQQMNQPIQETAKYINSSNSDVYDKSKTLYGFYKARQAIRENDQCVIVEGYTDVMLSHFAGVEHIVAASGTALTQDQLGLIGRFTKNIVIAFDMDFAGDNATNRGIKLAQQLGFSIKIADLPQGKDPADVVLEDADQWKSAIKNAQDSIDFYLESAFRQYDINTIQGKKSIVDFLAPVLQSIENGVERSHWVQVCAQKLSVREDALWEQVNKQKTQDQTQQQEQQPPAKQANLTHESKLMYAILVELICDESLVSQTQQSVKQIGVDNQLLHFLEQCSKICENQIQKQDIFKCLAQEQQMYLKEALLKRQDMNATSNLESLLLLYKQLVIKKELEELELQLQADQNNEVLLKKVQFTTQLLNNI